MKFPEKILVMPSMAELLSSGADRPTVGPEEAYYHHSKTESLRASIKDLQETLIKIENGKCITGNILRYDFQDMYQQLQAAAQKAIDRLKAAGNYVEVLDE